MLIFGTAGAGSTSRKADLKNTLFGGEGLFLAKVTGPGRVWLQILPFSRRAGRVLAAGGTGGGKDEGSLLGGIGKMVMGGGE